MSNKSAYPTIDNSQVGNDNSLTTNPEERHFNRENLPSICVAICTRDRPQQLQRALQSLWNQTHPSSEILVVDNAPSDDRTRDLVTNEFSEVHYVREPVQGLNFARNRALKEASKEIVAFIDDDAVAESCWVETIQKMFAQYPRAGVCTGQVAPLALDTPGQILFEKNGGLMAGHEKFMRIPTEASQYGWKWRHMPVIAWAISLGVGCNLAVRRKLAIQLGGFDEALDMNPVMPGGGDQDIVWRMLESGAEVIYQPLARVRHEHRREMSGVYNQILSHQLGVIGLVTKAVQLSSGPKRLGAVAFLSWRLMKPGVRLLRRAFGFDILPPTLLLRIWWNCWRGLGLYSKAKRIAHQRGIESQQ